MPNYTSKWTKVHKKQTVKAPTANRNQKYFQVHFDWIADAQKNGKTYREMLPEFNKKFKTDINLVAFYAVGARMKAVSGAQSLPAPIFNGNTHSNGHTDLTMFLYSNRKPWLFDDNDKLIELVKLSNQRKTREELAAIFTCEETAITRAWSELRRAAQGGHKTAEKYIAKNRPFHPLKVSRGRKVLA